MKVKKKLKTAGKQIMKMMGKKDDESKAAKMDDKKTEKKVKGRCY